MSDGAACQVLQPPNRKETAHVGWRRVGTQVFSSPCPWGNCTKSLLVPPPNRSIYPWNSCPTLPSPSLPPSLCVRLSLSPLNMLQGDEDRFGCIITPVLSVPGSRQSVTKLNLWWESWAFAGTVRKGIQLKFTSGWLTLAQWGRMYTFLGGEGGHSNIQPFDYLLLGVQRF